MIVSRPRNRGAAVAVRVDVCVGVNVGVFVIVSVNVGVGVNVLVGVGVCVLVAVRVGVCVLVAVSAGDALCSAETYAVCVNARAEAIPPRFTLAVALGRGTGGCVAVSVAVGKFGANSAVQTARPPVCGITN